MIISNDKKIIEKINKLKAFGVNKSYLNRRIPGDYDANLLGLNYRMNEISAAIGIEQIKIQQIIQKIQFFFFRET